ncbi:MAG: DUF5009 domain-containing protein [Planctomycetaceae bacterium]|nr:DUF5009 domain-containing protein [Planctomycetaceae bacterium]
MAKRAERLVSLDAYRGFIMIMLAASGFGIAAMSRNANPDDLRWQILDLREWNWISHHFSHPNWQSNFAIGSHDAQAGSPWLRCAVSFWDLIQPAFMFMVGAAMPYSYRSRQQRGDTKYQMLRHAFVRAIVLTLLGVFLYSIRSNQTNWIFPNVLAQIGLGYFFVYLISLAPRWGQITAFVAILFLSWTMFAVYQVPESYAPEEVNAKVENGEVLTGFFGHWTKNGNAASAFDEWFLNQFPLPRDDDGQPIPYKFNAGGYTTLNFFPAMATMLLGVFAGQLLMSERKPSRKLLDLLGLGGVLLLTGILAGATCCPIIKRIWTPSWVLLSGAYVMWGLALFYLLFDVLPLKRLAFPMVIVGMNSLAMYLMGELLRGWFTKHVVQTHFGDALRWLLGQLTMRLGWMERMQATPETVGQVTYEVFQPMVDATSAFLVMWLIAYYMYRQRIHVRI